MEGSKAGIIAAQCMQLVAGSRWYAKGSLLHLLGFLAVAAEEFCGHDNVCAGAEEQLGGFGLSNHDES